MFAGKRKNRRHFICEICRGKYQQSKEKMSQQPPQYIQPRDKPMRGFVMQKYPKPDPYPRKELIVQRNCPPVLRRNGTEITLRGTRNILSSDENSVGDTLASAGYETVNHLKLLFGKIAKEIKQSHDDNKVLNLLMTKMNDAFKKHTDELIEKAQQQQPTPTDNLTEEKGIQTEEIVLFEDDKLVAIEQEVKRIQSYESLMEDSIKKSHENTTENYRKIEGVCSDLRSVVLSELNICKSQISDLSTQISTAKIKEADTANELELKNRQLQIKCEKLEREVQVLKDKLEQKDKSDNSQILDLNLRLKKSEETIVDLKKVVSDSEKKLLLSSIEKEKFTLLLQYRDDHITDIKKEFNQISNMADTLLSPKRKKNDPKKSTSSFSVASKNDLTSYATSMTSIVNLEDLEARLDEMSMVVAPSQNEYKSFMTNSEISFDLSDDSVSVASTTKPDSKDN